MSIRLGDSSKGNAAQVSTPAHPRLACLGSTACITLAALGLFAAAPALAADPIAIPLGVKYDVDKDGKELDSIARLTIQIGVNGGPRRTFMFDTGSAALVGQVTDWDPTLEQEVTTYGNGDYGNLVQWVTPKTLDYATAQGTTGAFGGQPEARNSLTRVVLEGGETYSQMVLTCAATPDECDLADEPIFEDKVLNDSNEEITRTWWAVKSSFNAVQDGNPAEDDGTYGTFGAGNFIDKDDKYSALGASTTSGYVISANVNQTKGATPTPGCAPCVTLNLNASIRAQFDTMVPWNVTHEGDSLAHFPGSDANASRQYEGSYSYVFTYEDKETKEKKTATLSGPALLDTGTGEQAYFTQIGAIEKLKDQGLILEEGSSQTILSMTITSAGGDTVTLLNPQLSRQSGESKGDGLVIGLPFFLQTSVMYDLQNKVTAYSRYFVSTDNFTTSANGAALQLNRVTPAMGNSYLAVDNKQYGSIGFAGSISGTGDLTIASNADVRMTGVNSYTGATVIEKEAILYLAGPGSISQSSKVVADGEFNIERHGANNLLWGVEDADDKVAIRSLAGSGHVALLDKTLVLTAAADDFTGKITDLDANEKSARGGLSVMGGTQTLSGINSFTGTTAVSTGAGLMLRSTGSLAGPVVVNGVFGNDGVVSSSTMVNSGGVLSGAGRLNHVIVASGGTLAPGSLLDTANKIVTLTVDGNLVQQAGSTYAVDIGGGFYDSVSVGGTALIEKGAKLVFVSDPDLEIGQSYTVLTAAGGVTGSYDLSLARVSAFVAPTQIVTATAVSVSAVQDRALANAALTVNQIEVATAADTLSLTHTVRDELLYLDSDAEARDAFDSLSGDSIASIRGALLDDSAYLSRGILRRASGGIDALALAKDSPTVMWMEGETRHMQVNSDGDFQSIRFRSNGFRLGVDRRFGDVVVGAAAGYSDGKLHTTDRSNEATAKGLHLGLYGLADFDGVMLTGGWTWSRYKVNGDRIVDYGSITESLDSRWTGKAHRLFAEVGHAFGKPQLQIEPFVGLSYATLKASGFEETGGDAALQVASDKQNLTTIRLGARGNADLGKARLRLGAAWEQNSGDRTSGIVAAFNPGGDAFVATGMTLPKHLASIDVGVGFAPVKNGWLGVDYGGRFASRFQDHRGRLSFDYRF